MSVLNYWSLCHKMNFKRKRKMPKTISLKATELSSWYLWVLSFGGGSESGGLRHNCSNRFIMVSRTHSVPGQYCSRPVHLETAYSLSSVKMRVLCHGGRGEGGHAHAQVWRHYRDTTIGTLFLPIGPHKRSDYACAGMTSLSGHNDWDTIFFANRTTTQQVGLHMCTYNVTTGIQLSRHCFFFAIGQHNRSDYTNIPNWHTPITHLKNINELVIEGTSSKKKW